MFDAVSGAFGDIVGGAVGGYLGYKGVEDTNVANRDIASARNAMEVEEAKKSRDFSSYQAAQNRSFQNLQVEKQMGFQERMSNSAVQRRMLDMQRAGINPILAGKFEAGSPAGAAGTGGIPASAKANSHGYTAQNKIQGLLDNMNTAISLKKLHADARKSEADAGKAENLEKTTRPGGTLAEDADNAYKKAKGWSKTVGKEIGSSAHDLKVKVGKLMNEVVDQGTKLTNKHELKKMSGYDKAHRVKGWDNEGIPQY